MSRRRRRNPFGPTDAIGIGTLAIIGIGAYLFYNWWKTKGPGGGQPGECLVKEALTGQPTAAPIVSTGTFTMPSGQVVPASCVTTSFIKCTNVAEIVDKNTGEVGYAQEGSGNGGNYVTSANPPACQCYTPALENWCCSQ